MELTDTQKEAVRGWAREGATLSDIQKRLDEQFSISLTYMDARFLLIDLGVDLQDKKTAAAPASALPTAEPDGEAVGGPGGAGVRVEIDRVVKPGSLVSGRVSFSDGVTAAWALDQMGRLALDAGQPGYRPSEEDLRAFQVEVSRELQKLGY